MDLQDILCWLFRHVYGSPGKRQAGVYDLVPAVYPHDPKRHPDKKHVDRSVDFTIISLNQEESLIFRETPAKSEAAELAEK